ncbi:MAG: DUF4112 domain-containing protein [Shimia sp.]
MPDPQLQREVDKLERLANRMDALFHIPGTKIRVGADALLGLIPGIGDTVALAPSAYIVYRSRQLGAPWPLVGRMGANAGIDALIGTIPLLGDLFDIGFKGNLRNVAPLKSHLKTKGLLPESEPLPNTDLAA